MLTYEQARCKVIEKIGKRTSRKTEPVRVWDALGFVLAQEVKTDREYPPFNRATRDGYAVFAADAKAGAKLRWRD
jgi:molybdopterin molybdotransferase